MQRDMQVEVTVVRLETVNTKALNKIIPPPMYAELRRQLRGSGHQPPEGDQTSFG
jgi:hypothetical protein